MSGKLVFTADDQEMLLTTANLEARGFARSQDLPDMLKHISNGGTAVVSMHRFNTGFRLPEGATVEFTENCPKNSPERAQAEARAHFDPSNYQLRPHQRKIFDTLKSMDPDEFNERLKMGILGRVKRATPSHRVVKLSEDAINNLEANSRVHNHTNRLHRKTHIPPQVQILDIGVNMDEKIMARLAEKSNPLPMPKDPFCEPVKIEPKTSDPEVG